MEQKVLETLLPKTFCSSSSFEKNDTGTVQHHCSPQTMPVYKSKLFKRNNGGFTRKPYPKRAKSAPSRPVYNGANPRPPKSNLSHVNTAEQKVITGTLATIALKDTGQCFHLDQISQGTGASQRLGQKHRVTGFHIRGRWNVNIQAAFDNPGYMLVWDRQPNEVLANPGDILSDIGSTDSSRAFPNQANIARFQILGRKTHPSANAIAQTSGTIPHSTDSSYWAVDDYWDFSDKRLNATQVLSGDGLIGDRISGALILLGIGENSSSVAANMTFNFRVFFEDI